MNAPNVFPAWWAAVIMALAVFRVYRLIAEDDIFDRPRDWLLDRFKEERLGKLDVLITCPWCLGWWLGLLTWVAWLATPSWTVGLCFPWALSALVALAAKVDERLTL